MKTNLIRLTSNQSLNFPIPRRYLPMKTNSLVPLLLTLSSVSLLAMPGLAKQRAESHTDRYLSNPLRGSLVIAAQTCDPNYDRYCPPPTSWCSELWYKFLMHWFLQNSRAVPEELFWAVFGCCDVYRFSLQKVFTALSSSCELFNFGGLELGLPLDRNSGTWMINSWLFCK